jgi:glyoxylase-like metal-dependent hydrolase (beta-lactamase superfamily II)
MGHSDRQTPSTVPVKPTLYRHPHGITAVDAHYLYPGHAAAHIVVDGGRAAFVDVGTNDSVPHLLAALQELGVPRDAVDYVLLTHVHLDHAGGAGTLMRELPHAQAVLHPRGAPHMIDPAKLIAGSKVVYGEERFARLYGTLVPIPPARVRVVADGERLRLGARELTLLHTRGHAEHHYVVVDEAHASIFTGDTFGLSYRALDTPTGVFIVPATVPTQFDPAQAIASIDRLLAYKPEVMYLMHFSRVTQVPRLGEMLKAQIREFVRIGRAHADDADPRPGIRTAMLAHWVSLLRLQGSTLGAADIEGALRGDLELNTEGLITWLQREKRA